jgi:UDP-N-acetylmuramoyl-tripeptide--D-alanyl-D-alanine ligase
MAALTLAEIARRTDGRILRGSPALTFQDFGIDSRLVRPGALFFAVRGERDGHDFVAAAAAAGAAGAVVSRPVAVADAGFGLVEVPDTVAALRNLARSVLSDIPVKVIGITGSVGKTTTKEFTAALLAAKMRVRKSEGNFNNQLGLALSVLRLEPGDEAAVLEMGMSAAGEIRALTRIAPPDVAVITNVQPVHTEFFDGLEDIALAKREILEGARPGAAAVLNADDPLVMKAGAGWKGPKVTFGLSESADVRARRVRHRGYEGLAFTLDYDGAEARVEVPFVNEAYVPNLLAAAAVCRSFGYSLDDILPRLGGLSPYAMRGVLVELPGGVRLYDDSYNSNPRALEEALRSLGALPAARKVAVLGDMLELGPGAPDYHRQAGASVARWKWDILVAVGPLARSIAEGALAAGLPPESVLSFPDSPAAAAAIGAVIRDGDLVLVKGSRGVKTEIIASAVRRRGKE